MDKYTKDLLDCSSKLDAMIEECGQITNLARSIISGDNTDSTIQLLEKLLAIANDRSLTIEAKKMAAILKDSLVRYYGHFYLMEICNNKSEPVEKEKTLKELLDELNSLVGLDSVKDKVKDLIAYQKVQKMRRDNNLHSVKNTLHLAFLGNPGTGKTTVARIVGRIYKQLGLLSKGHFVEVSRTDLIAGYQGQTALKVKKVIEKAKGGTLFIDEAYSLTENDHSDSYGRECLTELTKALEDYRDDLAVIVAGYTEPMQKFFESNPGLRSRFSTFIEFEDYSVRELEEILVDMCAKNDYELSESAKKLLHIYLENKVNSKEENFANGRMIRNLYEELVMNHARRVFNMETPNIVDLKTILDVDFNQLPNQNLKNADPAS
ncbi:MULTISPECIES: AAA family ATPase [Ruminococcus]|uniref:AAA family ATPase n=1 Tax=Ruminococcus TaxID=1263 RepID=UPI000E44B9DE|nr:MULTISPECIES: AAA family ATPase [Ruminococcus]RGM79374.1 AAA family ATPase [Ruminococcus sp. OM06-36AC]